jgi:hypothetical protein
MPAANGCDLARAGAFHGYTGEKEDIFRSVYSFLFALYNILITTFRTLLVPDIFFPAGIYRKTGYYAFISKITINE